MTEFFKSKQVENYLHQSPFFSICIPVYKNVSFLKRLLDSIFLQDFDDFEIIISDDSPDNSILFFLDETYNDSRIYYSRNDVSLGTPENWNSAIRKAKGKWIKLMHDDDWFHTSSALQVLYSYACTSKYGFIFTAYYNVFLDDGGRKEIVKCPSIRLRRVLNFGGNLYSKNIIGPPSVILIKSELQEQYDNRMKWLVDIDCYIRMLNKNKPFYINQALINVGMNKQQVTFYTHNRPEVEIPEGLLLFNKLGRNSLNHILYFDAWWRLVRNLNIKDIQHFYNYSKDLEVPSQIIRMIRFQAVFPGRLLKIGIISKVIMFVAFCTIK